MSEKVLHAQVNHVSEDGTVLARIKELGNDSPSIKLAKVAFGAAAAQLKKYDNFLLTIPSKIQRRGAYLVCAEAKVSGVVHETIEEFDVDAYLNSLEGNESPF